MARATKVLLVALNLQNHPAVPVKVKVRAKVRRVQTLMIVAHLVHLVLLVVTAVPAKLANVVLWKATNIFQLALAHRVSGSLLRVKKTALLVRLFWMENVRKAQSVENGMLLIANTSNQGAALLVTIAFLFTETKMAT